MPPPPAFSPPTTIRLPWVEPLVLPFGHQMSQGHGILGYTRLGQIVTTGASRAEWMRVCPELRHREYDDAVSVAIGLAAVDDPATPSSHQFVPVPVRMHELPSMLERAAAIPTSANLYNAIAAAHVPLRPHPSLVVSSEPLLCARATPDYAGTQVAFGSLHPDIQRFAQNRRVMGHRHKPAPIFWPQGVTAPTMDKVYVGYEFEASFGEGDSGARPSDAQVLSAMFRSSDLLGLGGRARPPRLHVETDSTVPNGFEIVTMPHELGHPETYAAMTAIFKTIMDLGGHNRSGSCGMHMHMSRTAIQNIADGVMANRRTVSNPGATVTHVEIVLHRFSALVLQWCERNATYYPFVTGRKSASRFARVSTSRTTERHSHINWANPHTLEFRWPGPNKFKIAEWPNIIADISHAMVDCTRILVSQERTSGRSEFARAITAGIYQAPSNGAHQTWAMRSLQHVIASNPDIFPFAYDYFFVDPAMPTGFVLL